MTARYAIYFAPSETSALHRLASSWLGRDAATGAAIVQPPIPDIAAMTAEPRRYGFHATLKPPFRLKEKASPDRLIRAVEELAAQFTPMTLRRIVLASIGNFLALVPDGEHEELDLLARSCVKALDGFRAPPPPEEIAARRASGLSPRQDRLLVAWGYPFVLDEFRFHMTLSNSLEPAARLRLEAAARAHFAPALDAPLTIDALTVFHEPAPRAPFRLIHRLALTGAYHVTLPEPWRLGVR